MIRPSLLEEVDIYYVPFHTGAILGYEIKFKFKFEPLKTFNGKEIIQNTYIKNTILYVS